MSADRRPPRTAYHLVPILSGTAISIAVMVMIMSTSGEWRSETGLLAPSPDFSPFFWIATTTFAWAFSLSVGSGLTVFMARPATRLQAAVYAVTVWAISYLIVGGMVLTMVRPLPALGLEGEIPRMIWGGFFGDLIGLVCAVATALAATAIRRRAERRRDREKTEIRVSLRPPWRRPVTGQKGLV